MNNRPIRYFLKCAFGYFEPRICPFCGSNENQLAERKYFVARLLRCKKCALYFRHPPDTTESNRVFYQETYVETDITRNLPSLIELAAFKANKFVGSGKDYAAKVDAIKLLKRNLATPIKLIDYGTSWGYASWQFQAAGFDVQSFEISRPMAQFGNRFLNLNIQTEDQALKGNVDILFSAHVIEHLPDIAAFIRRSAELLNEQGLFVCYSPNASDAFRAHNPSAFSSRWGMVHPVLPSVEFYKNAFAGVPYFITSDIDDLRALEAWDHTSQFSFSGRGDELLVIAMLNARG